MMLATYIISAMRMTVQKNTNHSTFLWNCCSAHKYIINFIQRKNRYFSYSPFLKIFTKTNEKIRNIIDNDNNSHVS